MIFHKKTAAFLLSLIICASAPVYAAFADNETDTAVTAEDTTDAQEEIKISGDFSYSLTADNTACIEGCTSIEKNLVIPDTIDGITVAELGPSAFGSKDDRPYQTITIPASINYISVYNPFSVCNRLEKIIVDSKNEDFIVENNVLYTKDKSQLICYPQMKRDTSFIVPDGVKVIGNASLYNLQLTEIKFPSTIESINQFALSSCDDLTSVDLSSTNLAGIGDYGFAYCSSLSDVKLPDTLLEICGGAFAGCSSLTEITLPENLDLIGQHAFTNTGLTKVYIPSSVTTIEYSAFGYTVNNAGEEVMDSSFIIVGELGSAAYTYATDSDTDYEYQNDFQFRTPEQDEEMKYMDDLTMQSSGDFQYAEIEGGIAIIYCFSMESVINVPSEIDGIKVTEIYPSAFSENTAEEIIIPEGISAIRKMAFMNCTKLKKITLPQSVTLIEDNVFDGCESLENIDLGGAVTVGSNVFNNCFKVKELKISGNCTSIGIEEEDPFLYLTSLKKFSVSDGDGAYSSKDGILFNKDKSVLVRYPNGLDSKKYKVPDGVKTIGNDAFSGNYYIEEVDLSNVETIGISAFENCKSLSSVKLSKNLKKVDSGAFYDCVKLKSVRLRNSDAEIGDFTFGYFYDESITNDDGSTGGNGLVEGFKLYTNKAKNDTGVEYAEKNNIEAVTDTVEIFGKNIRKNILWISGGGIAFLIAALLGSVAVKKSKAKKSSSPAKKKSKKKNTDNPDDSNEKDNENNEKQD